MIKQLQLKEFGDLLSLFIEVFDSFLASYDKKGCTHKNKEIVSHRFTFSISGEIDGYLMATINIPFSSNSDQTVCTECVEELIEHINQKSRDLIRINLMVNSMNIRCIDQFLYSVRQREPQITIRLRGERCIVDFYAFANKQTALPEYIYYNSNK